MFIWRPVPVTESTAWGLAAGRRNVALAPLGTGERVTAGVVRLSSCADTILVRKLLREIGSPFLRLGSTDRLKRLASGAFSRNDNRFSKRQAS